MLASSLRSALWERNLSQLRGCMQAGLNMQGHCYASSAVCLARGPAHHMAGAYTGRHIMKSKGVTASVQHLEVLLAALLLQSAQLWLLTRHSSTRSLALCRQSVVLHMVTEPPRHGREARLAQIPCMPNSPLWAKCRIPAQDVWDAE